MNASAGKPTIIVVSSHVATGSVGGRLQAFVLERLGFPVVLVPTVILPWHPGEGPGTRIVPPGFANMLTDLSRAPWLGSVGGIISGYLGDDTQAGVIADLVATVRQANPSLLYLCDPVLADHDGPYRAPSIVAAIRDRLLPSADITTPNRHELALMAGERVTDNAGLLVLARRTGVPEVVITSAFGGEGEMANLLIRPNDALSAVHQALPAAPHGTGDLFAALYLAHRLDGSDGGESLRRALNTTLRLVELAEGEDALPLIENQQVLFE